MNDLEMNVSQSNSVTIQQPGRFALFAIGFMMEFAMLYLYPVIVDNIPLWMWFLYHPIYWAIMIVLFCLIRKTNFFDYKSSSLCILGCTFYLVSYLLFDLGWFFPIDSFLMTFFEVVGKGTALIATILIVVGLLIFGIKSKGQTYFKVVLYLFAISQIVVCLSTFYRIPQFLYAFLIFGPAILFLFAIFKTCFHSKREFFSWLQIICANLVVYSAFNMIVYCLILLGESYFESILGGSYILAIVFYTISIVGGVMAMKPDAKRKRVRIIVFMVVAILIGFATKTETWDPVALSYLLILSATVYLVSFFSKLISSD